MGPPPGPSISSTTLPSIRLLLLVLLSSSQPSSSHTVASHPSHASHTDASAALASALAELALVRRERAALLELVANPRGLFSSGAPGSRLPLNQHAMVEGVLGDDDHLAVRPSSLPGGGRGTFARRSFEAGEVVGAYRCAVVDRATHDAQDGGSRTWILNATHQCDGSFFPLHNPILYVNSIAREAECPLQNTDMRLMGNGTVAYVATRPITSGDEVFADYGKPELRVWHDRALIAYTHTRTHTHTHTHTHRSRLAVSRNTC